jgi:hypothetical protein
MFSKRLETAVVLAHGTAVGPLVRGCRKEDIEYIEDGCSSRSLEADPLSGAQPLWTEMFCVLLTFCKWYCGLASPFTFNLYGHIGHHESSR